MTSVAFTDYTEIKLMKIKLARAYGQNDEAELLIGSDTGIAFSSGVSYLRLAALFYTVCFTGNTFKGLNMSN